MKKKPCVYIVALGGTIASLANSEMDEFYSSPTLEISDLLASLPLNMKTIDIQYEQVLQQISHEMSQEELLKVAKKINDLVKKDEITGIVVLQGTNCIEEIAYFMNLLINTKKPIVFTGAFRPANALGFDGHRNLYNAILLASNKQLANIGVILTFNDLIFNARDAGKMNPTVSGNFSGNEFGLVGYVSEGKPYLMKLPTHKHTYLSEFDINKLNKLTSVCIIYGHLGIDKLLVEAAIENNVAGIISAGVGKGYQPKAVTEALIKASQKGIFVVRSSRTGHGIINRETKIDDQYGFIAGGTLSPQKASILLSIALNTTKDKAEIQRMFIEY